MAELFDCGTDNIGLHSKNIYAEGELEGAATTEDFSVVRQEDSSTVTLAAPHLTFTPPVGVRPPGRD